MAVITPRDLETNRHFDAAAAYSLALLMGGPLQLQHAVLDGVEAAFGAVEVVPA
jgi:hypothetical protein